LNEYGRTKDLFQSELKRKFIKKYFELQDVLKVLNQIFMSRKMLNMLNIFVEAQFFLYCPLVQKKVLRIQVALLKPN